MEIWIVNPFDPLPGEELGIGRYLSLATVLAQRGHAVTWWSSAFGHTLKKLRQQPRPMRNLVFRLLAAAPYYQNIGFARVWNHIQLAQRFLTETRELLSEPGVRVPERVITSLPPVALARAAIHVAHHCGAKAIVDIQDAWPEAMYRLAPRGRFGDLAGRIILYPVKIMADKVYSRCDAVSAVARSYVDLSGASRRGKPNHVTYLGTSLSRVDQHLAPSRRAENTFVYAGGMSSNYDLRTVLRATSALQAEGKPFKLLLAGAGEDEEALKQLAFQGLHLKGRVEFLGYLRYQDLIHVLSTCHVAINPIREGTYAALPNKVSDYCATGLPVISSVRGELADLLRDWQAGAHYRAGDPSDLALAMSSYLNDPTTTSTQGHNARLMAESCLNRDVTYPIMARFIETC